METGPQIKDPEAREKSARTEFRSRRSWILVVHHRGIQMTL